MWWHLNFQDIVEAPRQSICSWLNLSDFLIPHLDFWIVSGVYSIIHRLMKSKKLDHYYKIISTIRQNTCAAFLSVWSAQVTAFPSSSDASQLKDSLASTSWSDLFSCSNMSGNTLLFTNIHKKVQFQSHRSPNITRQVAFLKDERWISLHWFTPSKTFLTGHMSSSKLITYSWGKEL